MTSAIHEGQHQQQRNQPLSITITAVQQWHRQYIKDNINNSVISHYQQQQLKTFFFLIKKKSNKYSPIQRQFRRTSSRNIRFVDANVLSYQSYAPHCCAKRALFSRQLGRPWRVCVWNLIVIQQWHGKACHWRELPVVSFSSRQTFCRDEDVFCRDKSMLVAKKVLSRQAYFSLDKRRVLSRQKYACRNKNISSRQN